eukprot:g2125.t1
MKIDMKQMKDRHEKEQRLRERGEKRARRMKLIIEKRRRESKARNEIKEQRRTAALAKQTLLEDKAREAVEKKQERMRKWCEQHERENERWRKERIAQAANSSKKIEAAKAKARKNNAKRERELQERTRVHDRLVCELKKQRERDAKERGRLARRKESEARMRFERVKGRREMQREKWLEKSRACDAASARLAVERAEKERKRREDAIIREDRHKEIVARKRRIERYKQRKTQQQLSVQESRETRLRSEKAVLRQEMCNQIRESLMRRAEYEELMKTMSSSPPPSPIDPTKQTRRKKTPKGKNNALSKKPDAPRRLKESDEMPMAPPSSKGTDSAKSTRARSRQQRRHDRINRYARDGDFLRGEAFYKSSPAKSSGQKMQSNIPRDLESEDDSVSLRRKMLLVEELRRAQNEELLNILTAEQQAEIHRVNMRKQSRSEEELKELDTKFHEERIKISERIMRLTKRHENELTDRLSELNLGTLLHSMTEAMNFMLNVNKLKHVVVHSRATVFEAFLQFLYTETLPKGIPKLYTVEELIYVAETYQFYTIEKQLAEIVHKTMTTEIVIDVLLKAVALNSLHLQRLCAAFIRENQSVVSKSKTFKSLRTHKDPSDIERRAVEIICDAVFRGIYPLPPSPPYAVDFDPEEMTNEELDDPTEFNLAADLARACAANIGADVQLISSKDELAVRCSHWLISIRSPRFASQIVSDDDIDDDVKSETGGAKRPSSRGRVVFESISSEALQALVLYLYSGELSAPTDVLVEMVSLASSTGLDDLFSELHHVPVATVTAANAVSILVAMKRRGFASENEDVRKVVEACYGKILRGWSIAVDGLADLLESDLLLFLKTINGAFGDGSDDRIDERIVLMHWKVMPHDNMVKKLFLEFLFSGGGMVLGDTPLACADTDQMRIALQVLDFCDDLGTKVLSERVAHAMLEMLENSQIFNFVRLIVESDKIGTGGGRDALIFKLLPSIAMLPSAMSLLSHDQAAHLLRHLRVSDDFPGKTRLENLLVKNTVTHAKEVNVNLYQHLPFDMQMRILGKRMEIQQEADDVANEEMARRGARNAALRLGNREKVDILKRPLLRDK